MSYNVVETVRVQRDGFDKGVLINTADFDKKNDTLFDTPPAKATDKKQALAEAQANLDRLTAAKAAQGEIDAAKAAVDALTSK